jgi:4-amino-4-deoxy-L-arabinose transferase-like glycosyltransferase
VKRKRGSKESPHHNERRDARAGAAGRRPIPPQHASSMPRRRETWHIAAIVALAFAIRLATVLWLADTAPYSDYLYYHLAGEKIASDWGFFFDASQVEYYAKFGWWPPVYPFFIGALYSVFGVEHRAVVFVQVLIGTAVCWLVYRLGRRLGGPRVAAWSALLVALDPTYVFATNLLASENLYVLWLVLGLRLVVLAPRTPRRLAGAGILFGLGALTRATGLVVPVVAALWLRGQVSSRRAWLVACAWMLGGSVVTIAPWTLRNTLVVGTPALVCYGGGLNFYFGHNADGIGYRDLALTPMARLTTQAAVDRSGYRLGWSYIGAKPLGVLSRGVRKVVALFGVPRYAPHDNTAILLPDGWQTDPEQGRIAAALRARQRAKNRWLDGLFTRLATAHSWLILAGGLVAAAAWRRLPSQGRLYAWLCLGWIAAHVLFWAQPRFRYPMEIFLVLLTTAVLTRAWRAAIPVDDRRSESPP